MLILARGFTDSQYNAFDGDNPTRGVYLCSGQGAAHAGGNPALLAVEVPDELLDQALRDRCPPADVDYLIPASLLNALPITRIE